MTIDESSLFRFDKNVRQVFSPIILFKIPILIKLTLIYVDTKIALVICIYEMNYNTKRYL